MRMARVYLEADLAPGAVVPLDDRAHRHIVQVLRLRPGAQLTLFNGRGGEYTAQLMAADRRHSRVEVTGFQPRDTRPPLAITLAQGIAKGDHMDYGIQKATELGVTSVQPLLTRRSLTVEDARRRENRSAHWRGVILSACEQCGRTDVPVLHEPTALDVWLAGDRDWGLGLVLEPKSETCLTDLNAVPESVTLLIGPEGGLDQEEVRQALGAGFTPLRLGPRILRTETAVVTALAVIQARWGDLL